MSDDTSDNSINPEPFVDVSDLPKHMRGGVLRYLKHGIEPGQFLRAILENNLKEAYARADEINIECIKAWVIWLMYRCPAAAQGSPEIVQDWIARGGMTGEKPEPEVPEYLLAEMEEE